MADYDKARAKQMKSSSGWSYSSDNVSKRTRKKVGKSILKSPLLLIITIALVVGAVGGFFLSKSTSTFVMNDYFVNGVKAEELDYVTVEVDNYKQSLLQEFETNGTEFKMENVYNTLQLKDNGVTIKFLGKDISSTVKTRILYREDITHDPVEVSKIDVAVAGVYYIEYTSTHFAYKGTTLIRTIVVKGVEVDG